MTKNFRTTKLDFFQLDPEPPAALEYVLVKPLKGGEIDVNECRGNMDIYDAKSMMTAAGDHLRFQKYAHKLTTPELHIYTDIGDFTKKMRVNGIGKVHYTYSGDLPIPVPHLEDHPSGWAVLNRRNGIFYLSHLGKGENANARKHDFLMYLMQGNGFNIRVTPFNSKKNKETCWGWADRLVASWLETDDEKAAAIRSEGIRNRQISDYLYEPVRQAKQQNGGTLPSVETIVSQRSLSNGSIIVTSVTGELVDLATISLGTQLRVYTKGNRDNFGMEWNGTPANRLQWARIADTRGWSVKIPEKGQSL